MWPRARRRFCCVSFVVVLTIAVLGTGIAAAVQGPDTWLLRAHKASFIVWFGFMTVHVLGHIFETFRLAVADFVDGSPVAAARVRVAVIVAALVLGILLALVTRSWADVWQVQH